MVSRVSPTGGAPGDIRGSQCTSNFPPHPLSLVITQVKKSHEITLSPTSPYSSISFSHLLPTFSPRERLRGVLGYEAHVTGCWYPIQNGRPRCQRTNASFQLLQDILTLQTVPGIHAVIQMLRYAQKEKSRRKWKQRWGRFSTKCASQPKRWAPVAWHHSAWITEYVCWFSRSRSSSAGTVRK